MIKSGEPECKSSRPPLHISRVDKSVKLGHYLILFIKQRYSLFYRSSLAVLSE